MEGCSEKLAWCKAKCPKWPVTRKCCFCVPIRKGVILFGYFNLVLSLLFFLPMMFMLVKHLTSEEKQEDDRSLMETNIHLLIDICMTILLLIGAHKKKKLLLKIYFYFGVILQLVIMCIDLIYFDFRDYLSSAMYCFFLGLNIYLLFLVYNTFHLIDENSEVQYIVCIE